MEYFQINLKLPTGTLHVGAESAIHPLAGFASRLNSSRGFLFVSKVLGKHYPSIPSEMTGVHAALASKVQFLLDEGPTAVIGFAETATGLGYGVFEALGLRNSYYQHTTRYLTGDTVFTEFQEPHSHAPKQYLYEPRARRHKDWLVGAGNIVFVDDEFTTGKTLMNAVDALRAKGVKANFIGVSILDWTGSGPAPPIPVISLLKGRFTFENTLKMDGGGILSEHPTPRYVTDIAYNFGRHGCDRIEYDFSTLAGDLDDLTGRVLVLGTGEFMNVPYLFARWLEGLGHDVRMQSTTRSPIAVGGDIRSMIRFKDNYGEGIDNFLYNVPSDRYSRIYLCYETREASKGHDVNDQLSLLCDDVRTLFFRS